MKDYWNSIKKYIYNLKLLILFLMTDAIFIVLHSIHKFTNLLPDMLYNIELDRGYAETFQYIKELWIILLLIDFAIKRRNMLYLAWCFLFSYLLFDDVFQLHERIGGSFVKPFLMELVNRKSIFGLYLKDYGELIVSVFSGAFLLLFIVIAHRKSGNYGKMVSTGLFVLLGFLVFFGVAVDMLHEHRWIKKVSFLNPDIFGLIEDGGEMIVMSVMIWFVFAMNQSLGNIIPGSSCSRKHP
jgi:hypothetical protein